MAGVGPPPKDPKRRARRNKPDAPTREISLIVAKQPPLPKVMPGGDPWPAITRAWWRMWAKSPLTATFAATDWSDLRDAAVLHGRYWSGDVKVASELRQRMGQFGATPESRARLRITLVDADTAESGAKTQPRGQASRTRYGGLELVKDEPTGT